MSIEPSTAAAARPAPDVGARALSLGRRTPVLVAPALVAALFASLPVVAEVRLPESRPTSEAPAAGLRPTAGHRRQQLPGLSARLRVPTLGGLPPLRSHLVPTPGKRRGAGLSIHPADIRWTN